MYFSSMVKQELARILPKNFSEQKGELLAFIKMKGSVTMGEKRLSLLLENPVMIKVVYFLFKKVFQLEVSTHTVRKKNNKKVYLVSVFDPEKTKYILRQLSLKADCYGKLLDKYPANNEVEIFSDNLFFRAFLRGAFLARGFVNDPERMYHLEISCYFREEADLIHEMLQKVSIFAKISLWQKKWAVYIKKSEEIFEFLRFIGVQRALLKFQDIIARKDLLNTVNRLVNCETANLDKTILSASRQLFYIDILKKNIGLKNLPKSLTDVAKVRLDHPYASIQELADIFGGGISKSGIFHRLKKIKQLALEYIPGEMHAL